MSVLNVNFNPKNAKWSPRPKTNAKISLHWENFAIGPTNLVYK